MLRCLYFLSLVPSAPANVKVIAISSTQLSVTWRPPSDPNGVITGYHLTWRMVKDDLNQSRDGQLKTLNLGRSASNHTIDNLGKLRNFKIHF